MRSETNQQSVAARNTKASERISRLRNSSRCSRKDIWPPSSSSLPFPVPSALRNVDMNIYLTNSYPIVLGRVFSLLVHSVTLVGSQTLIVGGKVRACLSRVTRYHAVRSYGFDRWRR